MKRIFINLLLLLISLNSTAQINIGKTEKHYKKHNISEVLVYEVDLETNDSNCHVSLLHRLFP